MTELTWHDWGIDAFQKASQAGKLILLDLTAFWCHYCHEMDQTTYQDSNVIELLNKNCVCVRVDLDKRPDIAERYNLGGYPTTVFLTATGLMIGGGTYFPPKEFHDMASKVVTTIEQTQTIPVSDVWHKRQKFEEKVVPGTKLDPEILRTHYKFILPMLDKEHGGIGKVKFPFPDLVRLLWEIDTDESNEIAKLTLNNILKLLDEKGGFYRFAQNANWSEPHKEKVLEANAQLLRLYSEAFERTKDERYKQAVDNVQRWMLSLKDKAFAAAVNPQGEIDQSVYVDKNAQAISAFLQVGKTDEALEVLDHILRKYVKDTAIKHTGSDVDGLLIDYAYLIQALIEAAEQTKGAKYLERADKLMVFCLENLSTPKGGFFDKLKRDDDIGYLQDQIIPLEPNVIMAQNLDKLAKLKKDQNYAKFAKKALLKFQNHYKAYGALAANYVLTEHQLLR